MNRRRCALCENEHSTWVHVKEDEGSHLEGIAQVAEREFTLSEDDGELSGDCMGEGFSQDESTEDEGEDDLTFSALTLENYDCWRKTGEKADKKTKHPRKRGRKRKRRAAKRRRIRFQKGPKVEE